MGLGGLRGRMIAVAATGTTLLVLGLALLTQVLAAQATEADARAIARARADGVASGIRVSHGRLVVTEGENDFLDATAWVFDASGRLIDGSVPQSTLHTAHELAASHRQRFVTHGNHLLYARPFTISTVHGSVVSTVDLTPFEQSERRLLKSIILMGFLTVAVAVAVAEMVSRRSLAAVHHMTVQADQWREHDVERRFDLGPAKDEITELGRTLDRMLDRISDALTAERRITDEIAHELRTPLTALRVEAQWARAHAPEAMTHALDGIIDSADRMEAAIRTVLDSARARAAETSGCDPAEVVSEMLRNDRDGDVELTGVATHVTASSDVVRGMVSPLLENARRHRATRAWVELATTERGVVLRVRDDGDGFASNTLDTAFAPGWSTSGGHGLGLAVVRRLAASHGVTVHAHPGPGGHVELLFPITNP